MNTSDKADYVRSQGQTRKHHCHWPGCTTQVPPAMWGCRNHWFKLPKALRDEIWRAYRPGQEKDMRPSRRYLQIAHDVQAWIKAHYPEAEGKPCSDQSTGDASDAGA